MGRVVREHYPASRLPEELRGTIASDASVKIIIEEEPSKAPSREHLMELMNQARRNATGVTLEEAVQRIRELRDEWD
jgi:hypothetical protein